MTWEISSCWKISYVMHDNKVTTYAVYGKGMTKKMVSDHMKFDNPQIKQLRVEKVACEKMPTRRTWITKLKK